MMQILGLYALLGMSFTIGKMLLEFVPPIFLIGIRMTLAGLCILGVQFFMYGTLKIKMQDLALFLIVSIIHIFIPYTTEFIALQSIAPSCAALMFNLTPCFTALFSYFIFREFMTIRKWIGFLISMVGVWYMIPPSEFTLGSCPISISYLLMLMSVISCSLGWVLVRKLLYRGYTSLHINGFAMLVGGIGALLSSKLLEPTATLPWQHMHEFLLLLFGIIILANFIFYNLYGFFLKKYTATLLSFVGFLTPLFTSFYDWLWLDITVDFQFYVATIIVAYGIYIFYEEELRQGYISKF